MSQRGISFVVIVCYYILVHNGVQSRWNIAKEKDLELEQQLKLLNKPTVKAIVNGYGDIYDCVEFYKQPAFDNPLLKDHVIEFPNNGSDQDSSKFPFELWGETCPIETVPIRRLTKMDLIRDESSIKLAKQLNTTPNGRGFYFAGFRTTIGFDITGAATQFSVHKPRVLGKSFSTSRIHIRHGPDIIEAGWRVDPFLYGDRRTRFFVRTDVGEVHCFNIRCAGFIQTNNRFAMDQILSPEAAGQDPQTLNLKIERLPTGNWAVVLVNAKIELGYWPKEIFTPFFGLVGEAQYLEWGAAVYSPPGYRFQAQMGSGAFPQQHSTRWDAFFASLQYAEKDGDMVEATHIEPYNSNENSYFVEDLGSFSEIYKRTFTYGSKYNVLYIN